MDPFLIPSRKGSCKTSMKRPSSSVYDDEEISEEMGAETEAEKHMKVLLEKQLNKKISIKDQFAQHRTFCSPSTYNPLTELVKGPCTLEQFKEIEKNEEVHQELQRCGLSEDEILDYMLYKSGKRKGKYTVDPSVWTEKITAIEEKIMAHNQELQKPQAFKNVKKLTRHEMDIEKSLYAGCPEKSKLSALVAVMDDNEPKDISSAFSHIKSLSERLLLSKKKRKKMQVTLKESQITGNDKESILGNSDFQYDCNIHHVNIPLEENEVEEKRLSIEEIRKLPRFENYEPGNPSKTLYLKNLHPKVTIHELRSLFGKFEEENQSPIDYKICTGRMRGQAFAKFSGEEIAEKALKYVNGYSLRGKPVIIEFGRKS